MTFIYVLGKIYIEREGFKRCLKSWMLRNIKGDDDENSKRDIYLLLIFVLIIRNRKSFLARLTRNGRLNKLIPLSS